MNKPIAALLASLIPMTAFTTGCSSAGGYGESVRFTATERTAVDQMLASGEKLAVPADMPFAIVETQRQSEGSGSSESTAAPEGTARCAAAITDTGSNSIAANASADFQLGHVIFSGEDKPLDVTVAFDCAYAYQAGRAAKTAAATETGTDDTLAPETVGLKFYVKDSNRAVLRRDVLVAPEGALGASHQKSRQASSFDLTLKPGLAYQLILAGRVAVIADETPTNLDASVEVTHFTVTVTAR